MPKIVYNTCYGGFSLSDAGVALYEKLSGKELEWCSGRTIPRHCPHLVRVVEELGPGADGDFAYLKLTEEVPEGQRYRINEYDGLESVEFPETVKWLRQFSLGERVTKIKGSSWTGRVVGFYSTTLTPEGYAVESETERGSVQIYPAAAIRALKGDKP